MLALVIVEGAAIVLLGLLVAGLLRSHAEILKSLHDLGAGIDAGEPQQSGGIHPARIRTLTDGEQARDITGVRLDGSAAALAVVGARHDTLLVFLSSGCLSCRPFWQDLSGDVESLVPARIVVVAQDEDHRGALRELAADTDCDVLLSSQAWSDYGVPGSPHAVLVHGPTGRVLGEGTGQDLRQVVGLLTHARDGAAAGDGLLSDPRDNAERIDRELAASGILHGHPSLYPDRDPGTAG